MPSVKVNGCRSRTVIGNGRPWVITPGGRFSKDYPRVRSMAQALAERGTGRRAGGAARDAQCPGAPLGREVVGDHGMRGRTAPGLADADTDPAGEEQREARRRTAEHRHQTPEREARREHRLARRAIGDACDRAAGRRVEEPERRAGQEAELPVGEPELCLDRLEQDREDLPEPAALRYRSRRSESACPR
jgi:hypothetical protein